MTKPDYAALFAAIANTANTVYANNLLEQAYTFVEPLSNTEIQFFNYMEYDYVENDPGYANGVFISYAGVYINNDGEYSGEYP